MVRQGVASQPAAVLDDDRRLLLAIDHADLARAVKISLAVGSAHLHLTVGIHIPGRNRELPARLDHQQVGPAPRLEFESVSRAARNHDVIEITKRQRPEHRVQHSPAAMHEHHFVGVGVAEKLFLAASGRQRAIVTSLLPKSSTRPLIGSPDRGIAPVFDVMMPERGLFAEIRGNGPGRLEPRHSRRRTKMIDHAVGPRKSGRRDHFLIVDSLVLESGNMRVGDVVLARNRAESQILRHGRRSETGCLQGCGTTRLRKVPSRSIESSTKSPGLSQPPATSGVSSRMQPVPTVPEPITSPGRKVASRLACASSCGHVQYIEPEFPRDNNRPFRVAVISR